MYHVQTEDSGPGRATLTTHVFYHGTILSTTRTAYAPETAEKDVQRIMQDQHKQALKQLRNGSFDELLMLYTSSEKGSLVDLVTQPGVPAALQDTIPNAASSVEEPQRARALLPPSELAEPEMAPIIESFSSQTGAPSLLADVDLAELIDLAAGSLESTGSADSSEVPPPTVAALAEFPSEHSSEVDIGQVLELEAEPPSEDEVLLYRSQSLPPVEILPVAEEAPAPAAPSASSPRRSATHGGVIIVHPRQGHDAPQARAQAGRKIEDLPAEKTRVRIAAVRSGPTMGVLRQPGSRSLRNAFRHAETAIRPQPTAEGVVVKRPSLGEEGPVFSALETDPRIPIPLEERSLDQVILAYLAEDVNNKK